MGKATYNLKIGTVRMLQNKAVNFLGSYSVSKKKEDHIQPACIFRQERREEDNQCDSPGLKPISMYIDS